MIVKGKPTHLIRTAHQSTIEELRVGAILVLGPIGVTILRNIWAGAVYWVLFRISLVKLFKNKLV